jgi:pimeloyl-ACP methyl ester carboxylesterase
MKPNGPSPNVHRQGTDETISSRTAEVDGLRLHYMTAGHGTPLILLHGYAETSRMWRPIIPLLAEPLQRHRTRPARHRRLGHSVRRSGYEKRRYPHS